MTNPSHALVVYGSLKPGEMNHHHVADIQGEWVDGTIRAELGRWRQYLRVALSKNAQKLPVKVLISSDLPNHWTRLDAFEGEAYERVPVDVETERGIIRGFVYAKPAE